MAVCCNCRCSHTRSQIVNNNLVSEKKGYVPSAYKTGLVHATLRDGPLKQVLGDIPLAAGAEYYLLKSSSPCEALFWIRRGNQGYYSASFKFHAT